MGRLAAEAAPGDGTGALRLEIMPRVLDYHAQVAEAKNVLRTSGQSNEIEVQEGKHPVASPSTSGNLTAGVANLHV